jgi:subtilase family serine protease
LPERHSGACGPQASQKFKNVPDLASNAAQESVGLIVYQGALVQSGGTSAAAPTWAATLALLRSYEQHPPNPPTGFAQLIYQPGFYKAYLTPITGGSNGRYYAEPATESAVKNG